MIIVEKNEGTKIDYLENGTRLSFADGELTLNLARYQKDDEVVMKDIMVDSEGFLTTGKGRYFVAQVEIPAKEYDIAAHRYDELPISIYRESGSVYVAEGPRIERMLGYTNLESEKGFNFFQNYMKEQGIIDEMKKLGLQEGNTVRVGGLEFEYYE